MSCLCCSSEITKKKKVVRLEFGFMKVSFCRPLAASPQPTTTGIMTIEEKVDADGRSVYVGNVR